MFRNIAIFIIGSAAIANLNAGQIQIGQIVTGVNNGLTTTYVTGAPSSTGNCSTCIQGSTTGFAQRTYDVNMFSGATPAPTPFTGYSNVVTTTNTPGSTIVDSANNVTFAMISQPGNDNNMWAGTGAGSDSIVIPMGIFGVSDVWTMLNDYYGKNGVVNTTVQFAFSAVSANDTVAANLTTVTVNLTNGGQIRSAVDCTASTTNGTECSSLDYAMGALPTSTLAAPLSVADTVKVGAAVATNSTINVLTHNLFSAVYTNAANVPYVNTSGNVVLDDQGFQFGGAFANDWLVSMTISAANATACSSSPCLNGSRPALSAITVNTFSTDTSVAPEPSTVFLLLGGIGTLGFAQLRRKRS